MAFIILGSQDLQIIFSMNLNLEKFKKELLFLPLGGSGEIGLNCNLYHYNGKWLIVDMGIGFTDSIPGVDVIAPDISFIKENLENFLGIVITHIHEDHIGAIQYLWEELKLPIYTSKFASLFLKEKLSEYQFSEEVKIIEIEDGQKLSLKPFDLEFINLTHSTPEMNAILIKTPKGNILHTGDWKFEEKPIIGKTSNKKRLKQLGNKENILAMISESTNIFQHSNTKNEVDLLKNLKKIVKSNKKGLVVCAIFASNISRIITLSLAAKAAGRKIGIIGRSIYRILKVADEMNYLPKGLEFVSEEELDKYDKKELLIIATGCQGEPNSGLAKLANDLCKRIKLNSGDTIIFSSRIIPGNEKAIHSLYNKLSERDVKIMNAENEFVHLSGHYTRDELIEMYKLVKPKMVIAVHGEEMHLAEHKRVAKECGVSTVIKGKNGDLIKIDSKDVQKSKIIDHISLTNVAVDGKRLLPLSSHIINERKKLAESGIILLILKVDRLYKLLAKPSITAVGNYDLMHEKLMNEMLEDEIKTAYDEALIKLSNQENTDEFKEDEKKEAFLIKEVNKKITHILKLDMGKKPFMVIKIIK